MNLQELRRDSGFVMLIITTLFIGFSSFAFWLGFLLVRMGVNGEFKIVADFKGWRLYFTSVSPGLFLIIAVVFILCVSLPGVLHPRQK